MANSVTCSAFIQREPLQEQRAKPDIDKLTQIFHLQHATSELEKKGACFEAVLQDCLDKRWFRIHQARDALFGNKGKIWHLQVYI